MRYKVGFEYNSKSENHKKIDLQDRKHIQRNNLKASGHKRGNWFQTCQIMGLNQSSTIINPSEQTYIVWNLIKASLFYKYDVIYLDIFALF